MKPPCTPLLIAALLAAVGWHPAAAQDAPVGLTVELLADTAAVVPGVPFRLGVRFRHNPGFHTYWQAPGIVGMATSIVWQLPPGFQAAALEWPPPQDVRMLKYKAYGYDSETMLVARITPPQSLPASQLLKLTAHATWMACSSACHPGTRLVAVELPVAAAAVPSNQEAFAKAAGAAPRELALDGLQARVEGAVLTLSFTLPPQLAAQGLRFIPESNLYDPNTEQKLTRDSTGRCEVSFSVMPLALESLPATLTGLVVNPNGWPQLQGARFGRIAVALNAARP